MGTCCSTNNPPLKQQEKPLGSGNGKNGLPEEPNSTQEVVLDAKSNGVFSDNAQNFVMFDNPQGTSSQAGLRDKGANVDEELSDSRNALTGSPHPEDIRAGTLESAANPENMDTDELQDDKETEDAQYEELSLTQIPANRNIPEIPLDGVSLQKEAGQFVRLPSAGNQPYPPSEAFISCRSLNALPSGRSGGFRRLTSAGSNSRSSLYAPGDTGAAFAPQESSRFFSCRSMAPNMRGSFDDALTSRTENGLNQRRNTTGDRPPLVPSPLPLASMARTPSNAGAAQWATASQRGDSLRADSARFHSIRSLGSEQFAAFDMSPKEMPPQNLSPASDSVKNTQPGVHKETFTGTFESNDEVPHSLRVLQGLPKKQSSAQSPDASVQDTGANSVASPNGSVHNGSAPRRRQRIPGIPLNRTATNTSQSQEPAAADFTVISENSTRGVPDSPHGSSMRPALSPLNTISPTSADTEHCEDKVEELASNASPACPESLRPSPNVNAEEIPADAAGVCIVAEMSGDERSPESRAKSAAAEDAETEPQPAESPIPTGLDAAAAARHGEAELQKTEAGDNREEIGALGDESNGYDTERCEEKKEGQGEETTKEALKVE